MELNLVTDENKERLILEVQKTHACMTQELEDTMIRQQGAMLGKKWRLQ